MDLLHARLSSQGLTGPPAVDAVEATRRLLAVQGQDPRAARLAIRVRTTGVHSSDVERALTQDRSLIITWVNRGTLHLIASEDEPLLHALTTPQLRSGSDRRLSQEGVTPAALELGIATIVRALGDEGPQTRAQLRGLLDSAGVPTRGQAFIHILFRATLDGLLIRGPMVDGDHAFVLREDWLGPRPQIDRERALAELALRYLRGHGPADARDLSKWAGLPLRDTRAGLSAIADKLDEYPGGLVDLKDRRAVSEVWPPPRLLGPFDPLLLGWSSRDQLLDAVEAGTPQTMITANGIIKALALIDGRAAGTWTLPKGRVALKLWADVDASTAAALAADAIAVEDYLR